MENIIDGLKPQSPSKGPPFPRFLNQKWPWIKKVKHGAIKKKRTKKEK
jgi:hypothetical protein